MFHPFLGKLLSLWLNYAPFHSCFGQLVSVFVSRFSWYMKNFGMRNLFAINIFLYFNNFGPKNQNCLCRLKFGTSTNPGIWNSMVILSFSDLEQKYSLDKFGQRHQNCRFKVKFGTNVSGGFDVGVYYFRSWLEKCWGEICSQIIKVLLSNCFKNS